MQVPEKIFPSRLLRKSACAGAWARGRAGARAWAHGRPLAPTRAAHARRRGRKPIRAPRVYMLLFQVYMLL